MTAPLNQSLASIRVAGREYPATGTSRCGTCSHPERESIERNLVRGWSPATIAASLPPDRTLTARQIGDHFRGHLPIKDEAVQRFRQQEADVRGEVVDEGAEQVVTALEFARRVMVKVDTRLASGDLLPGVTDGLRAAQVLAEHEDAVEGGYSREDVTEAFLRYLAAIRANCTSDQIKAIGGHLRADPVMRELIARTDGADGADSKVAG